MNHMPGHFTKGNRLQCFVFKTIDVVFEWDKTGMVGIYIFNAFGKEIDLSELNSIQQKEVEKLADALEKGTEWTNQKIDLSVF